MHLFDLLARTEDALIPPEILQVVPADPLARALELIGHGSHETVLLWQVVLELLPSNQGVAKEFELVFLRLEEILEHHCALSWSAGDQIETHVIVIGARILVAEALFLLECVDVAQLLSAGGVFLPHDIAAINN